MSNQLRVTSYLEDVLTTNPSLAGCEGGQEGSEVSPGLNQFSGSYMPDECQQGMLGGAEYYRAYRESELARMAPDVLARSVKSSWDEPFLSIITPEKPAAVALAGYSVFGPENLSTTTRNMTLDLRGEAAYAPNLSGEMPVGASVSSYAMGAAMNFADCAQGCGCNANPAGIQLPGAISGGSLAGAGYSDTSAGRMRRCTDNCRVTTVPGAERDRCMQQCGMDQAHSAVDLAGSNDDLLQDCVTSCSADAMGPEAAAQCAMTCAKNFSSIRGSRVLSVHPASFFSTPKQVQPVTVLRPYHVSAY